VTDFLSPLPTVPQSGRTALSLACLYGFPEIMKALLLTPGADPNSADEVTPPRPPHL
jgi:ankyrin repeat protein